MQRGELSGVLHRRVDVGAHAEQEEDALDVRLLDGEVQEVTAARVQLQPTFFSGLSSHIFQNSVIIF